MDLAVHSKKEEKQPDKYNIRAQSWTSGWGMMKKQNFSWAGSGSVHILISSVMLNQTNMREQMMQSHTNTFEKTSSNRSGTPVETGAPDSQFSNNTILWEKTKQKPSAFQLQRNISASNKVLLKDNLLQKKKNKRFTREENVNRWYSSQRQ